MGSYKDWDEETKVEWLLAELQVTVATPICTLLWASSDSVSLQGRRPLISPVMEMSPDVKEVLDTFNVVAQIGSGSLGAYVISMASNVSDVLAVELLQREARVQSSAQQVGCGPPPSLCIHLAHMFSGWSLPCLLAPVALRLPCCRIWTVSG